MALAPTETRIVGCMKLSHGYLPTSHEIDRGNEGKYEKIAVHARFCGWREYR